MRPKSSRLGYRPSIRDMTITDKRKLQYFGIPEYKTPKFDIDCSKRGSNQLWKFSKTKIISYFTEQAEKMKNIPSSAFYSHINQWSKVFKSYNIFNHIIDENKRWNSK